LKKKNQFKDANKLKKSRPLMMSANKLNLFHWHITDSHSFPLVVPSKPDLVAKGSYGSDMQYSPDDVTRIVQFGLEHGVRVLLEIDSPGGFSFSAALLICFGLLSLSYY
jgi:N-acetyl-beta-hexosaminidase